MSLGQKIKLARLDKGLTQRAVVGDYITRNMLSKIENDAATPSVRTLEYLAHALDLPASHFLSDAPLSDGSAPDGLDEVRHNYRTGEWLACLACMKADPKSASTDEGYLLQSLAGCRAAQDALAQGDAKTAQELAETALYYNQEGMYGTAALGAALALVLSGAYHALGTSYRSAQRGVLTEALAALDENS